MLVISRNKPFYVGEVLGLIVEPGKTAGRYIVYGIPNNRENLIPLSIQGTLDEVSKAIGEAHKRIESILLSGERFLVHFSDQAPNLGISVEVLGEEVKKNAD